MFARNEIDASRSPLSITDMKVYLNLISAARRWSCVRSLSLAGLVLIVLAPPAGGADGQARRVQGPLRICQENPRYFADDSGKAMYLTGSHTWNNLQDMGPTDPPAAFDYEEYLYFLDQHHHNFIRLWRWELVSWNTAANNEKESRIHFCAPHPWARTGPEKALDGKPKFDLNTFDGAYFERLRARLEQANRRGICVSIMLFEGWGLQFVPEGWKAHPFNPANNSNAVGAEVQDGKGLSIFTLAHPEITRVQEAYVRKVIDTVNDLDNVLYEISNENYPPSTEWQTHFIRFVHDYERTKPKQHPVGMTFQYQGGSNAALMASPADWISPNPDAEQGFNYRNNPPAADGRKVILSDTDHLWGIGGDVAWVWKTFLRGLNPLFMDPYRREILNRGAEDQWESVRAALGHTRRFADRMHLAAMVPHAELATTGYCLAQPGVEYLVFQPKSGEAFSVELKAGSYRYEWFNANKGAGAGEGHLEATGGRQEFMPPFAGNAVLYLKAGDSRRSATTEPKTAVSIVDGRWRINGQVTYPGTKAEGLLLNVRMVNSIFEDVMRPEFDPEANTDEFVRQIPDYVAQGIRAFTINLQGGMPGYEGAVNSAFRADGSLRDAYLRRARRVIEACDRQGAVVILGCFYQRQDQLLQNEAAVRSGVVHVAQWIQSNRFSNVALEIANEFGHSGFDRSILKEPEGQVELIRLAKQTAPGVLVSTSGLGGGTQDERVARAGDFVLIHFNSTTLADIPRRIAALKKYGKPIVCNEDPKSGTQGAEAARLCVSNGASWGLMLDKLNQHFPFSFRGALDDPVVYAAFKELATAKSSTPASAEIYYPPPESAGGWRMLKDPQDIRRLAGADPAKLDALREWLLQSDDRNFAAVVIRHGYIVLQVERGNSAKTDSRRVASVSKAVCATVLAIASEQSQRGMTPRRMTFDDRAFDFIPWAQPLSDPRKAQITVRQLLNHTSGICPEATGAPNDGSWEYIMGHTGDARTAKLAFDPGTGCGYSTHALDHASLVCENVTGKPYDQFAIEALFKPLGIEHWWFQYYDGGEKYGRHPSHGLGMPARDLARIAYCMLHEGRWKDQQVIPKWFVDQTAAPTHDVRTPEMRWGLNPQVFSLGWELPARHWPAGGHDGHDLPADARDKPGSGGQLIAFVPSLDLVITRQTGSSGEWQFEEYLRRACAAVLNGE